jgi:hypothetical protein
MCPRDNANLASCPGAPPTTALPFTSSTRYDAGNRVTGTISASPNDGNPFLAVRNSYDAAGRLTKVETGTLSAWQSQSVAPASWSGFTIGRPCRRATHRRRNKRALPKVRSRSDQNKRGKWLQNWI